MKKLVLVVLIADVLLILIVGILQVSAQTNKIKVACIGNSITYGYGIADREKNAYPAQLQALLGNGYEVKNYGVSGTTLLKNGDQSYWKTLEYQNALKSKADIVFIKLGTNDSKLINRKHFAEFNSDYRDFITSFKQSSSHARIILLLPLPSFSTDSTGIWEPVIVNQIIPFVQQVAFDMGLEVLNLHALVEKATYFPDRIHPNIQGQTIIANRLFELLKQQRDTSYNIFGKLQVDKKNSSFHGYECANFKLNGRDCKIVKPKWSVPGHPWIWRARFWDYEPQTDISLLEHGFHVVYCDVAELFGNKEAITLWNEYYKLVHNAGLSKKAALEGMSRGGVYIYNWAAENPEKVACTYADNAVLDLKSWPGAKGKGEGNKNDWETFKKDYGYTTEEQAMTFAGSPINKVAQIVKGGYPMLHLVGDADEGVPPDENTLPFEKQVKALGGNITVMHKPGMHHHPHSFVNPTPIVDFILKANYN